MVLWAVVLSFLPGVLGLAQDEAAELARSREMSTANSAPERLAYDVWGRAAEEQAGLLAGAVRKRVLAELASPSERVSFVEYDVGGERTWVAPEISRRTEAGEFAVISDGLHFPQVFMLHGEGVVLGISDFAAKWTSAADHSGGNQARKVVSSDPFLAAAPSLYRPVSARMEGGAVVVRNVADDGPEIEAVWSMGEHGLQVECRWTVSRGGQYSVGFAPFASVAREQILNVLLPPRNQYRRLPASPQMLLSSMMPHALALVEVDGGKPFGGRPLTYGVAADPRALATEWPTNMRLQASYGFSLLGADGRVQPTIFAPVLGDPDSTFEQGQTSSVVFRTLVAPLPWHELLGQAITGLFAVRDYRYPVETSLSGAALNIFDLLNHEHAAGWNPELKGFYNIEFKSGVTQAAPLAVLSAAMLSRDETLYRERALPTIAYLLSRPGAHFGRLGEIGNWSGAPFGKSVYAPVKLAAPNRFYGTTLWQGLHGLTGRLNPWMEPFVLPDGKVRPTPNKTQSAPAWSAQMAAYRFRPSDSLLESIKDEAGRFIAEEVTSRDTEMVPVTAFYDVNTYADWSDLPDLYELTGDRAILDAARVGAYHTVAGIWSHPILPEESMKIHPDDSFRGDTRVLFRGAEWYRLGVGEDDLYEDASGRRWTKGFTVPEKSVPSWQVSPIGLGFEQPSTFYLMPTVKEGEAVRKVFMSATAPALLRLGYLAKDPLLTTVARNLVIGRFGNYPGYYASGYTDSGTRGDFPVAGPDVNRIYYHHIPPHLAFTLDFLVTQAITRSGGEVDFPWVKQQGYAWFTSRVYGADPGRVYDVKDLRLLLARGLNRAENPLVDWLLAESPTEVVLIAMSQSDQPLDYRPDLEWEKLGIDRAQTGRFRVAGEDSWRALSAGDSGITIPPKGLAVFRFPRGAAQVSAPKQPVGSGPVQSELGGEFGGQLHAFRIRNPYFEDAVFAYLSGGTGDPYTVAFSFEPTGEEVSRDRFPYEAIAYPVPAGETVRVRVVVTDKETKQQKECLVELKP